MDHLRVARLLDRRESDAWRHCRTAWKPRDARIRTPLGAKRAQPIAQRSKALEAERVIVIGFDDVAITEARATIVAVDAGVMVTNEPAFDRGGHNGPFDDTRLAAQERPLSTNKRLTRWIASLEGFAT